MNQTQDKPEIFPKQFNRVKEGIRLSKYVEYDDREGCFVVNGHAVYFDRAKGWRCDCEDRVYTNWWCKHMVAILYYMGGLPQAQEMIPQL